MTAHPCARLGPIATGVFERIAVGQSPLASQRSIAMLLKRGLIEQVRVRRIGRDPLGAIEIPEYEVPLPIHMQWCKWCDENVTDAEIAQ
jgi:hypothetical protein